MATAKNAGCKPIGMATGIFNKEELRKAGAEIVIKELKELETMKL
jgi:phosphoglycolate phosphatase-like HAD superfamily hydrolase